MRTNILGTEYTIKTEINRKNELRLETRDAFTDISTKEIIIAYFEINPENDLKNIEYHKNKVLRHEIIHAFLYESGLWINSNLNENWAMNEEMVDWLAIQYPKIHKIFEELDILE